MGIPSSDLLAQYLLDTRDPSAANEAMGKKKIAYYYDVLLAEANNYIIERTKYGNTQALQRSYLLPPDYIKMKTVQFYDGSDWVPLIEAKSVDEWNYLTASKRYVTAPSHWFVFNEQGNLHLELDGIPSVSGPAADTTKNLAIIYEGYQDRLQFSSDYITGTISITKGQATVTGVGTAFTAAMVGKFIRPTGGKYWYDLKGFTDTTHMTLVNYFQEETISGAGFTIAEIPRLPAEFGYTPLWGAVRDYYLPTNADKAKDYEKLYARDYILIEKKYKNKSKGSVTPGRKVGNSGGIFTPRNYPNGLLTATP